MSRYVMVETISMFKHRYCVEVPDDVEEEMYFKDGTRTFPCTPEEWAMDTVTCEEAIEFTQKHIDECITDAKQVSLEEALKLFRKEESFFDRWDDATIIKNHVTSLAEQSEFKNENDQTAPKDA